MVANDYYYTVSKKVPNFFNTVSRSWRRNRMGEAVFSFIAKIRVDKVDSANMTESLGERKQQGKILVLLKLEWNYSVFERHPTSLRWKQSWSITAGQCDNPLQLDWLFYQLGLSHDCNFFNRSDCGEILNRTTNRIFPDSRFYERITRRRFLRRERVSIETLSKYWKMYRNVVSWINLKSAQNRGPVPWQTNSNAIILDDFVSVDCLEKMENHKSWEI